MCCTFERGDRKATREEVLDFVGNTGITDSAFLFVGHSRGSVGLWGFVCGGCMGDCHVRLLTSVLWQTTHATTAGTGGLPQGLG